MIQNPNSCKQGYDPDHRDNPYHVTLLTAGFEYSHSTPVIYPVNEPVIHHTYKRGPRSISVWKRNGWKWEGTARSGSGHGYYGSGIDQLVSYLKNMRRGVKKSATLKRYTR